MAEDNVFTERLGDMQANWKEQMDAPFEDNRIPPGQYKMQLQAAELTESMSSGNLQIHREHVVMDGEQTGRVAHDYMQLQTDLGPRFIAQWITQMGFQPPDDIRDLPDVIAQIADAAPIVTVRVKHSGDFQNLYIQKLVEYGTGGTTTPAAAPTTQTTEAQAPSATGGDVDDMYDEMVAFCEAWQIQVGQSDTAATLKAKIGEDDWQAEDAAGNLDDDDKALLAKLGELGSSPATPAAEPAPAQPAPADGIPTLGAVVEVEYDGGELFKGTITAVNPKNETATVKFEDGDEDNHPFADITVVGQAGGETEPAGDDQAVLTELVAFCQAQRIKVDEADTIATLSDKVAEFEWHRERVAPREAEMLDNLDVVITWAAPAKKKTAGKKK
jgi:hypothetical protein